MMSAALLEWLNKSGAETSGLRIGPSPHGGLGAFAARDFKAGEALASIPHACVVDTTFSSARLTCSVRPKVGCGPCSDERMLAWLAAPDGECGR